MYVTKLTSKGSKMIIWKFNILEFKRGREQSSQLALQWTEFVSVRKLEKSVPNLPHGIYFHAQVFGNLSAYENWKKVSQICRTGYISTRKYLEISKRTKNWKKVSQICRKGFISTHKYLEISQRTKTGKKCPKFAARHLFPRTSMLDKVENFCGRFY